MESWRDRGMGSWCGMGLLCMRSGCEIVNSLIMVDNVDRYHS